MDEREKMRALLLDFISLQNESDAEEIESKEGVIISEIDTISPDPAWLDYIYQTDDYLDEDGNVDVDALLRKVYSYKPISL